MGIRFRYFLSVLIFLGAVPAIAQKANFDDLANFVSGESVSSASPLNQVSRRPVVQSYSVTARALTTEWREKRLNQAREWAKKAIHPYISRPDVVKYPFSGPDFVHVATLFPGAAEYILVGLEPLGSLPEFTSMSDPQLAGYLGQLNYTLRSISKRNFFITKEMREDFGGKGIDGVYPVLLYFASLTRHEVLNMRYIKLTGNGRVAEVDSGQASGIQMDVRSLDRMPGFPSKQSVYYFRTDLSNSGFKPSSSFARFVKSRAGGILYLKAASYLMHTEEFSNIRNYLVGDCRYVLQDASGIPADFLAKYYGISYFGNYRGPIDMFSEFDQPGLRAIYQSGVAQPLPFGTGYRMSDADSVQMFGVRK